MSSKDVSETRKKKSDSVPVYLNVYDLTTMNSYAHWFGLGVYHSGVEVHGVEYAFGAHEHPTTGIFEVEPKKCPGGFTYRKSLLVGKTEMGSEEVHDLIEKLSEEYRGNKYHLIKKNCNHFCNDLCLKLTQKPIPRWVNRLARLGLFCNCMLPASVNEKKVRRVEEEEEKKRKKKLRSQSSRVPSSSSLSEKRGPYTRSASVSHAPNRAPSDLSTSTSCSSASSISS